MFRTKFTGSASLCSGYSARARSFMASTSRRPSARRRAPPSFRPAGGGCWVAPLRGARLAPWRGGIGWRPGAGDRLPGPCGRARLARRRSSLSHLNHPGTTRANRLHSDHSNRPVPRKHKGTRGFSRHPVGFGNHPNPPRGRRFKSCHPDRWAVGNTDCKTADKPERHWLRAGAFRFPPVRGSRDVFGRCRVVLCARKCETRPVLGARRTVLGVRGAGRCLAGGWCVSHRASGSHGCCGNGFGQWLKTRGNRLQDESHAARVSGYLQQCADLNLLEYETGR